MYSRKILSPPACTCRYRESHQSYPDCYDTRKEIPQLMKVHRRFEIKSEEKQILVVDDYAHHPTEIKATLKGARQGWGDRIIAVFQPHLYSRTRDFYQDFGQSFFDADVLIITDIYPAREEPIPGVTGELIAKEAKRLGHPSVLYIKDKEELPDRLMEMLKKNDLVMTIGAGDIWKTGESLIERIKSA